MLLINRVSFLGAALLALAISPAEAAWQSYYTKEPVRFSFDVPGELKSEKATYNSAMVGQRDAIVFKSAEDSVEFTVTVVNFTGRTNDESALIKEATATYLDKMTVLADDDARVDSSYGRKVTVDLPDNGGRSMTAIFFKDNYLIRLQANVLPGGNPRSYHMGRFVDSLAFNANRADEGAIELKLAE